MDVIEAIFTRYSETKVRPDPVPRELIERLLEAAVQAPNHHRVRPWRFFVLLGEARAALGQVMAESLLARKPDVDPVVLEAERAKPLRAPLLIAVAADHPMEPRVVEQENRSAAAAAVENLLLAAHALGLGAIWRTGGAAYDERVKAFLGLDADQALIALIYIGYPQAARAPLERGSYEDRTVWMS